RCPRSRARSAEGSPSSRGARRQPEGPELSLSSRFLENLIDEFARLPSIGRKTAQRLALHVLKAPREEGARLVEAILLVKERVGFCSLCGNYAEQDPCPLCADPRRDHSLVCVVEQPVDVPLIRRTATF